MRAYTLVPHLLDQGPSSRSFLRPMCRPTPTALLVTRDKRHHGRRLRLYFTNENHTELYYERQELLRAVRSKGSPRSERRMASLGRAIALWGRASVPFFRA